MDKVFSYLLSEYNHDKDDMIQFFGADLKYLESTIKDLGLDNINTHEQEKHMMSVVDDFMIDVFQIIKKKKRAY